MEAGWSVRRIAHQLGRSDCVVRRCWDQWIREMSFTRRLGSGSHRQTSRREDLHIVKNACVQLTASSAALQAQIALSLGAPVSSRTIRRCLAEGHLGSWGPITCAAFDAPPHRRLHLEYCRARGNWIVQWNGTKSSLATNPDSISAVITIVFLCGNLLVSSSILPLLSSDPSLPQLV
ncbi:HTH_Tnp_Tc3_2 domain-containing protein [Trichonephila clavipes]|nr:HTH_Tnp_Tc3_2 domain-containing protein [Trichonephila clavipes]